MTTADIGTGLIWAADGAGLGCYNGGTRTWAQADAWAAALDFGGYTDWRMPTYTELTSIVNANVSSPAINADAFPSTQSDFYWSSTTYAGNAGSAWYVDFDAGDVNYNDKSFANYVRAVRGG